MNPEDRLRETLRQWDPLRPFREVLARHYRDYLTLFPNTPRMCGSCAFRDGETRLEGMSLLYALEALATGARFYCHRDMPVVDGDFQFDPARLTCFTGWQVVHAALQLEPAVLEEFKRHWLPRTELRAFIQEKLRERTHDQLARIADPTV